MKEDFFFKKGVRCGESKLILKEYETLINKYKSILMNYLDY